MSNSFSRITTLDICKSLINYSDKRENSTTKNYFKFENRVYPVMNIIKIAMEINGGFEPKDYNNFHLCKEILIYKLKINNNNFFKVKEKND